MNESVGPMYNLLFLSSYPLRFSEKIICKIDVDFMFKAFWIFLGSLFFSASEWQDISTFRQIF